MTIRLADKNDLDTIAELSYRKNAQAEYRVAYCCRRLEHIRNDYAFMIENKEHMVLFAEESGKITGVLGVFCIEEIKRLDCCGPFTENDFEAVGTKLIQEVRKQRPGYRLSFYFNRDHEEYLHMANALGAKSNGLEHRMSVKRVNVKKSEKSSLVQPIVKEDYQQLADLHNKIFPGLYLTGDELVRTIGEERQVFVVKEKDTICAYGVLEASEDGQSATAEVFAVEEHQRGKGYGRLVVNEVLRQGFEQYDVEAMDLIVDDENYVARSLYESVGFVTVDLNYSMSL